MAKVATAVATLGIVALLAGCDRKDVGEAPTPVASDETATTSGFLQGDQPVPDEVEQWVESVRRECADAGGLWVGISDFVLPGDFNGDGLTDYLLTRQGIECPAPGGGGLGAMERLQGNAGPGNDFLISQPGGQYRIYDGFPVPELTADNMVRRGDRDVIILEGRWPRPGGDVHRIIWGWNGQAVGVIERQNASGQSVDEDGLPSRDARPAASAAASLPFREGGYEPIPANPEYTAYLSITASAIHYGDTATDQMCRIESSEVNGMSVRLIIRCGECEERPCISPQYGQPYAVNIRAESSTILDIAGINLGHGDGRYRYVGPGAP